MILPLKFPGRYHKMPRDSGLYKSEPSQRLAVKIEMILMRVTMKGDYDW